MHTTNYFNTFIQVADDCPVRMGEVPPQKTSTKTVANLQFEMVADNPYQLTSDDVLFNTYLIRNEAQEENLKVDREIFFSKGQPCLRSSALAKRYGWGIHHDENGKVALFAVDSIEYKKLKEDDSVKQTKAMSSKKARPNRLSNSK